MTGRLLAAGLLLLLATGAAPRPATLEAQLTELHDADRRLAATAYRLLLAAAPLCAETRPLPGLLLHAASQYPAAARPALVNLFGLDQGVAISAVAPGSPAAASGLQESDQILAFDGSELAATHPGNASYEEVEAANRALESAAVDGAIAVTVQRGSIRSDHRFKLAAGCAARVQVRPSDRLDAGTDGNWISVSPRLVAYADDDELGFIFAHELAHVIRGHRVTLESGGAAGLGKYFGKGRSLMRASEDEADALGVWLMADAGYDPAKGPAFLLRFGKDHGPGIFSDGTHRSGKARAATLEPIVAELLAARADGREIPAPDPRDLSADD